ncbi:hypothetical protein DRJ48_02800 [Candidatus Woesearchaeota archaeon]|nr:Lrp/AsnC family transcriptional regulator [Candidatus Woesearchaeota archaeon]RLE42782.1 MAG: hypothetical protein DRJ48_02800 [Candidatus Woesearchaeota archaeon]
MPEFISIQRINETETRSIKLDKKDMRIVSLLLVNSRIPFTQMAKEVMLSKDAVKYRITKLQERGLVLGFFPQIDFRMLGFEEFKIKLLLDEAKKEKQDEMLEEIKAHPNVERVIEYSDRWDVEITVLARDIREFDEIDLSITDKFRDIILQKEKTPIIKSYLKDCCPLEFQKDKSYLELLRQLPYTEKPKIKVDTKDLLILKHLSKDCRASTYEIAPGVNLSADAVGLRIKRMLKSQLIEKFTIALNYSMLKYHMYSFEADLSSLDPSTEKRLIDFSISHPFIFSAKKTLGYWDVVIKIMSNSPKNFHETITGLKAHFSEIIRDYQTLIAFREAHFNPFPDALLSL